MIIREANYFHTPELKIDFPKSEIRNNDKSTEPERIKLEYMGKRIIGITDSGLKLASSEDVKGRSNSEQFC